MLKHFTWELYSTHAKGFARQPFCLLVNRAVAGSCTNSITSPSKIPSLEKGLIGLNAEVFRPAAFYLQINCAVAGLFMNQFSSLIRRDNFLVNISAPFLFKC
jgi:hypothetical protein